jgi:hypothetical protein
MNNPVIRAIGGRIVRHVKTALLLQNLKRYLMMVIYNLVFSDPGKCWHGLLFPVLSIDYQQGKRK